jgi:hypothetical protein
MNKALALPPQYPSCIQHQLGMVSNKAAGSLLRGEKYRIHRQAEQRQSELASLDRIQMGRCPMYDGVRIYYIHIVRETNILRCLVIFPHSMRKSMILLRSIHYDWSDTFPIFGCSMNCRRSQKWPHCVSRVPRLWFPLIL